MPGREISLDSHISDQSKIRLFPVSIEQVNENDYSVKKQGAGQWIATRRLGAEAIRLLDQGLTVGETKERLAIQIGRSPDAINVSRLLSALIRAEIVRAVDGVSIRRNIRRSLKEWWRHTVYSRIHDRVYAFARDWFPISWVSVTLSALNLFYSNPHRRSIILTAAENMALAFPDLSPKDRRRLAANYFRHQARVVIRAQASTVAGARVIRGDTRESGRLLEWCCAGAAVEGLEHLEAARRGGKGVILCGYHFGFIFMIPFVLAKLGYSITSMGLVHRSFDEEFYRLLRERMVAVGYGAFAMLPQIDLKSMATLTRLLSQGEIILLFGEAYIDGVQNEDSLRYLGNDLKRYRPSQVPAPLLGRTVSGNKGIGWLHETTGAPVLPTALIRRADGCDTLVVKPALPPRPEGHARERIAGTVRATYAALEDLVRANPSQWCYWKFFHKM